VRTEGRIPSCFVVRRAFPDGHPVQRNSSMFLLYFFNLFWAVRGVSGDTFIIKIQRKSGRAAQARRLAPIQQPTRRRGLAAASRDPRNGPCDDDIFSRSRSGPLPPKSGRQKRSVPLAVTGGARPTAAPIRGLVGAPFVSRPDRKSGRGGATRSPLPVSRGSLNEASHQLATPPPPPPSLLRPAPLTSPTTPRHPMKAPPVHARVF
jgi:hypothetical protein